MEANIQRIVEQFYKKSKQDKPMLSQESTALSEKAIWRLKEGKKRFLTNYNPATQREVCSNQSLCYFGDFPSLAKINSTYGVQTSVAWLIPQLMDLSEFCGCKDKLQGEPLEECAWLIAQNYFYLKISELMLFFNYFKQGRYGRFYGSVDPLVIMTSLQQFLRERNDAYFAHESELNKKRMEEQIKNGIPYTEYLRQKKDKELNQQKVQQ